MENLDLISTELLREDFLSWGGEAFASKRKMNADSIVKKEENTDEESSLFNAQAKIFLFGNLRDKIQITSCKISKLLPLQSCSQVGYLNKYFTSNEERNNLIEINLVINHTEEFKDSSIFLLGVRLVYIAGEQKVIFNPFTLKQDLRQVSGSKTSTALKQIFSCSFFAKSEFIAAGLSEDYLNNLKLEGRCCLEIVFSLQDGESCLSSLIVSSNKFDFTQKKISFKERVAICKEVEASKGKNSPKRKVFTKSKNFSYAKKQRMEDSVNSKDTFEENLKDQNTLALMRKALGVDDLEQKMERIAKKKYNEVQE